MDNIHLTIIYLHNFKLVRLHGLDITFTIKIYTRKAAASCRSKAFGLSLVPAWYTHVLSHVHYRYHTEYCGLLYHEIRLRTIPSWPLPGAVSADTATHYDLACPRNQALHHQALQCIPVLVCLQRSLDRLAMHGASSVAVC